METACELYRASGAGGQQVAFIPDMDMVAVITANLGGKYVDESNTYTLIPDYIIPAAE